MKCNPRSFLLVLLLAASQGPAAGLAQEEPCIERVFGAYCLGGEISRLQRNRPDYIRQQRDNDRFALVYAEGGERYYVMAYRNRIYKVLRQYPIASSGKYRELRDQLTSQYGVPRETSRFPIHARGLAGKIAAIQRGEGKAVLEWRPVHKPWRVELSWTAELGLSLAYIAVGREPRDLPSTWE